MWSQTGGLMDFRSNCLEPTVGCGLKIEFMGSSLQHPPWARTMEKKGRVKLVIRKHSFIVGFTTFPVISHRTGGNGENRTFWWISLRLGARASHGLAEWGLHQCWWPDDACATTQLRPCCELVWSFDGFLGMRQRFETEDEGWGTWLGPARRWWCAGATC